MPFGNSISQQTPHAMSPDTAMNASDQAGAATGTLSRRGNSHALKKASAERFLDFNNRPATGPDMNVLRSKLGNAQVMSALSARSFVGPSSYFLNTAQVSAIPRSEIPAPERKLYVGYNRVSQQLSHIATTLYHVMTHETFLDKWNEGERGAINPIEIQLAVIGDKLHVSSNFHSDKLARALHIALSAGAPDHSKALERTSNVDKHAVRAATCLRHFRKFHALAGASANQLKDAQTRLKTEIDRGMGVPSRTEGVSPEIIGKQGVKALETISRVLTEEAGKGFPSLVVHAPPTFERGPENALPPGVTETRHAEQNIEDDLARNAEAHFAQAIAELGLSNSDAVIVPMAGKFVACAVCAEAEKAMQAEGEGGVFAQDSEAYRFNLHRSGDRIGHAYANEVQQLATHALHPDQKRGIEKATTIRDNFVSAPNKTMAWKAPVAAAMIPNRTDSESEAFTDPQ